MHPRTFAPLVALVATLALSRAEPAEPGLLFHLSADHGTTADFSAAGAPKPTYEAEIKPITDGAHGGALQCGNYQLLAYRAPGNIFAQRGTLSFYWRSRYPVGPTAFPIFRVGYADHSSWDMVFLRIDYNGHGFDAFVTDANLARTRVSIPLTPFPGPTTWTHLTLAWDENRGIRFYIDGRLAGKVETKARYDLALDQFGPHSRVISPYQVQSDYNFVRGGDIDEVRIYDHMLGDNPVAALARGEAPVEPAAAPRSLADPAIREEWAYRFGWNREAPPALPDGPSVAVRKVEIHDAYDLKRWWWKANDGIVETTWPGVYNRSRLPGRNDYFQLPDWDCYVESGKSVTFALPSEPANHLEITGSAWGRMDLLPDGTAMEAAYLAQPETTLFDRPQAQEKSIHALRSPLTGRQIRFTNVEPEEPIAELGAYYVTAGTEPAASRKLSYRLVPSSTVFNQPALASLETFINGRFSQAERGKMLAQPADQPLPSLDYLSLPHLPIVHIGVPDTWDGSSDGLDGIALDLPALSLTPTHGERIAFNVQVKDPLWPARNLCDFTFSVKAGQAQTLWFDLRDRLLPAGKPLWVSIACSSREFNETTLLGANLRLVFKPGAQARAEHELDRFTQVRDVYAMMVEEHPHDPRLDLWNRFKADLDDLLRVNPDHVLGRQYAAAGAGGPRPQFPTPDAPAGVPLWAFRQVALLGQVKHFVEWYIDHRQVAYGDFGGGISDDVDLLNTWPGLALMGCDPGKIAASNAALLDAAYKNGMFTRGLPTIQADELHSYEEGINCLGQNLIVNFGSPRQLERAMVTARGIESITGVNSAGHRHIRTSYYSGSRVAEEEPWGYAKPYSYLVLQVPELLVDFNGSPAVKQWLQELTDGVLAHYGPGGPGTARRGAGVPAIRFTDDREEDVGRGYFPSHIFWSAYKFSGDRKYLAPILQNPMTAVSLVNANLLDLLDLRTEWHNRLTAGERAKEVEGRRTGARDRTSSNRMSESGHFAWQVTGDKAQLEQLYAQQSQTCAALDYINTEGSLWIDRVGVPTAELQRARLGGVALVRNGVFPGHAISWRFAAPATEQSVAILVPYATTTSLRIIAYNLEATPVHAAMTGWNIDPGVWELQQGIDTDDDDKPDMATAARNTVFERSRSIEVTLAPHAVTVLTLNLKTPGTPYWQRPDIGIDPEDVKAAADRVTVRVHSLGSVTAPATTVALRDGAGKVVATADVPELAAPVDLQPKTTDVTISVPAGHSLRGCSIELDPDHRLNEITRLNNTAPVR